MASACILGITIGALCIGAADTTATTTTVKVCPVVQTWSAEYQRQLAKEYRAAPAATRRAIEQAVNLRDQARACRAD